MKHVYCIGGMGADEKVFSKLIFAGCEIHFINWIIPGKNEPIDVYAKRLTVQIQHHKPVLCGLSFGGMMCIEIAKLIMVEKIILISSVQTYLQLPLWMRLTAKLKLNRIFPLLSFRLIEPLENYKLGVENYEEKEMVNRYRKNSDKQYINWAINALINWKNTFIPKNLYHIHGDKDRLFPLKNIKPNYILQSGGHFMIMNRSEIVNKYININFEKRSCK